MSSRASSSVPTTSSSALVPAAAAAAAPSSEAEIQVPDPKVLANAFKLSVKKDKPIKTDYWVDSCTGKCKIGEHQFVDEVTGKKQVENLLIKDEEEFTSPIEESYCCKGCYILVTTYSIYIVHGSTATIRINADHLQQSS